MFHMNNCKQSYQLKASILSNKLSKISYMETPGQRIKQERIAQGWSQQQLANEIGRIKGESISRAAIAQWEIGSSKTQTPENFFAAAQALGLNPYWVLNGTGEKYTSNLPALPELSSSTPTQSQSQGAASTTALPSEDQRFIGEISSGLQERDIPDHIRQTILILLSTAPKKDNQ